MHYLEKICKGSDEFSEMMSNTPLILYRLMRVNRNINNSVNKQERKDSDYEEKEK